MYDTRVFSKYTHVPGSTSIHNLRTVALCYGELLALLVYLTVEQPVMSRHCPTSQRLCPLHPWVGQRRPQRMAPRPPMVPYKATVVGFDGAMVGSLVLGVPNNTRRN
jgi:hypothetical protein